MDLSNPTIHLTPLESTLRTLLLDVATYIQQEGITEEGSNVKKHPETVLRFTGGWVRDKLLGVDSHDIDVGISSMTGYQFGMALKDYLDVPENLEKYKKSLPSEEMSDAIVSLHKIDANPEKSKHLETVTTKIFGLDIDLVNLRKETYSEDSRNPQMEFGTAEEDALRRDATINALFYNLNESKLEDLTKRGLDDMKKHIIRTPLEPYQTFKDDPLRVLRLIRFASRLGYQIDPETESAMQNEDISVALKLKISKERVLAELEKMLHGPDPHGALQFIDRLGLYPTIFANHQDKVTADTSTWPLAYNALARLLQPESNEAALERVRNILLRDKSCHYNAWMIAAFAPWTSVPARGTSTEKRPPPTRPVEVGRDSLKADNKTLFILRDATLHFRDIIECKNSLLGNTIQATPAEIRQQIGLRIRSWGKEWRLCVVLAILQEVMGGRDLTDVAQEYDQFLAYVVEKDLDNVCELKPIVNGGEIMQHLGAKKGPWMSRATSLVLEWQLLHPEITDKSVVLEEISARRAELGL
ncbi:CCA tRNA nucleotidyltransferase, mitochondrial [Penicillium subrubescens]|uniref:CCA tRNA nucleotidyltransferase, mitochondrial n=2 Tax=Penicillium subrubescens TaxID=1316194 RepID=A0A1Q5ULM6_9EURO|nr:CCA tRNA nucleotidyltransferase, mitochondrial [Penicillium subrubescens]